MLFFLSQTPHEGATIITGGHAPGCVIIGYVFYFGTGLALLLAAGVGAWRYRRVTAQSDFPCQRLQFAIWAVLLISAVVLVTTHHASFAIPTLLIAFLFPSRQKRVST